MGWTIYTAPESYDFDGLFMEEKRLLGLKVCVYAVSVVPLLHGRQVDDAGNLKRFYYLSWLSPTAHLGRTRHMGK